MADESAPKKRAPRKTAAKKEGGETPATPRVRKPRKTASKTDAAAAPEKAAAPTAETKSRRRKKPAATPAAASERASESTAPAAPAKKRTRAAPKKTASTSTSTSTTASRRSLRAAGDDAPAKKDAVGAASSPRSRARAPSRPSAKPAASPSAQGWQAARVHVERWRERADPYLRLCRLDRPIGFLLLLWPTWWGLWAAAEGFPPWGALVIFTLGVVVMRSAGCVINDYADRWLDPQVARTRTRPLAAGEVTPKQALALFFGLLLTAFVLVLFTNALTMKLAVVGAVLAATYPFLKRYTHLPQIYLGIAFGWAIPMAFAAVQGEVPRLAWLLFLANILWSTAYDTLYAMVDRDDDLKAGAKSTAILFGDVDLVAVGLLHGTFLLTMLFVGQRLALGWAYWVGLAIAGAVCALQLWRARRRDREGCFQAFLDNNWVGLAVFAGLAVALALK